MREGMPLNLYLVGDLEFPDRLSDITCKVNTTHGLCSKSSLVLGISISEKKGL